MNDKTQNIIAVVAGVLAMVAIQIALIPVMQQLLKNTVTFSLKSGIKIDHTSIYLYSFLNLLILGFIGGFITCWIARNKKLFYVLLTGVLAFVISVTISLITTRSSWVSNLVTLTIIPLTFIGGIVRRMIENKRQAGEEA